MDRVIELPDRFERMPEECLHWIRKFGEELAKASARRAYEEENKKTVLAALKAKAKAKTVDGKETEARSSDEWQQYLSEYGKVFYEERYYHHGLASLRDTLDAWRTQCANGRREWEAYKNS